VRRYPLQATLLSPLVVKRDRQSERSEGVSSISGTLVRGALAQAYLRQSGEPDRDFRHLFLDESACRFGPLDPAPCLFPLTAVSCKRYSGFRPSAVAEGRGGHGVADLLWARIALHLHGLHRPLPALEAWRRCQQCANDLKPLTGFWLRDGDRYRSPDPAQTRHSVAVHVGIDRASHTAAESVFYALEALDPANEVVDTAGKIRHEPTLTGWVEADADAHRALRALLEREKQLVFLGHARTRGYGRVQLQLGDALAGSTTAADQQRWDNWSAELIRFLGTLGIDKFEASNDFFFAVSLPAGAILLDGLLRYTLDLAEVCSWLPLLPAPENDRPARVLEGGGTLRCVTAVAKQERIRGWNAAHGLPRQDEWGLTRGAVYAYWFEGDARERAALQERLSQLERHGLGVRRNEGFGTVTVSDDFHRLFHRQET
jgi:CRISPR-associated Csx10 family RAMP protein